MRNEKLSRLMLAYHTVDVTVLSNLHTGVNVCGRCVFFLQLGMPVCCRGHLSYLRVEVSAFLPFTLEEPGLELQIVS
jgi:hypothetical protein